MGKISDIIQLVDDMKPNAYTERTKLGWIAELDGKVAANVMLMSIADIRQMNYSYPEALNFETLVEFPHDGMYQHWLEAKIDYANGEYNKYQNSMEQFNAHYGDFVRWFTRSYEPAQGYVKEGQNGSV